MTDKKIEQEDLRKALQTLQDLTKGHSSGGTATTKVETMVGESGSTQLFHTPSNSDPGSWAGSTWRGEGWEDSIEANGTDMGALSKLGKSIASAIMTKLSKGQELSARELNFVSKGGLNFLSKAMDDKKEDKEEVEKAQGHSDEKEDKELVREMVKPGAMKGDVQKSFLDHAQEAPAVSQGFEVSEFLAGFAGVMHKSLMSMEERITDRVLTAVASSAAEQNSVQKSMAEALGSLGEVLSIHGQRLEQIEASPARGPKSTVVEKSLNGAEQTETLTKSQIGERLFDLFQKSQVTQNDLLKFDATGEMSPEVAKKVLG